MALLPPFRLSSAKGRGSLSKSHRTCRGGIEALRDNLAFLFGVRYCRRNIEIFFA
jgi:hypothetical protein